MAKLAYLHIVYVMSYGTLSELLANVSILANSTAVYRHFVSPQNGIEAAKTANRIGDRSDLQLTTCSSSVCLIE